MSGGAEDAPRRHMVRDPEEGWETGGLGYEEWSAALPDMILEEEPLTPDDVARLRRLGGDASVPSEAEVARVEKVRQ